VANYVGETISVISQATDPARGTPITDAAAEVEFYAPGKNPAKVVDDRTADKGPFTMAYDDTVKNPDGSFGAYVAEVPTTGWADGKWAFKVTLSGSYDSWEYSSVKLEA
jgi:hypothetical protein